MLPVAMARSCVDDSAIDYVLQDLSMMSCFHVRHMEYEVMHMPTNGLCGFLWLACTFTGERPKHEAMTKRFVCSAVLSAPFVLLHFWIVHGVKSAILDCHVLAVWWYYNCNSDVTIVVFPLDLIFYKEFDVDSISIFCPNIQSWRYKLFCT